LTVAVDKNGVATYQHEKKWVEIQEKEKHNVKAGLQLLNWF